MGFLNNFEILSSLSEEDKNHLEMFCQKRYLNSGEILFKEGDDANALYIIEEGLIEVYSGDKILGKVGAGDMLGEIAVFSENNLRMASSRAVENTSIIVIMGFSIRNLANTRPEMFLKIQNIINQRKENNKN